MSDTELLLPPRLTVDVQGLVLAFFEGRNALTRKAYGRDLQNFSSFVGASSLEDAAKLLLGQGQGGANALVLSYRSKLLEQKLAPATINRRLAALKSLMKLARLVGLCSFELEVPSLEVEALRDTRGPGLSGLKRLLVEAQRRSDKKGLRDYAILRLLADLALRRGEVCSLDLSHVDLEGSTLWVLGKGKRGRQRVTLPGKTKDALKAWMKERGGAPGPLFIALDTTFYGHRLTGEGLCQLVTKLGEQAGLRARPHGLRHAAITQALDATGGDLRKVRQYSRHQSLDMLLRYDDARADFGGQVADLVSKST